MSIRMADDWVEIPNLKHRKDEKSYGSLLEQLKDAPVETVRGLLRDCKQDMDTRASAWARYRRKYRRGLQYVNDPNGQSYATNYAYNVAETAKANLVLGLPAVAVVPVEEGDDLAAEVMSDLLDYSLKRAQLRARVEDMVQNGVITGFGWLKVWYDPDAFFGQGDVAITAPLPEDMFIPGNTTSFEEVQVIIQRIRDVPEEELKATYKVDYIEGEDGSDVIRTKKKYAILKVHDMYEAWVKDVQGNWWYCAVAGNTLLQKPKKYRAHHGQHPFALWLDGVDKGAENAYQWGIGEIEEMEPLLDLSNAIDHRIYKNIRSITARQRVLNPASGIDRADVDDTPNKLYLCAGRPQDAMMWDNPPQLGTDVYLYREKIEDRIQIVTGIYDVAQGQKPSGIQAARAISALQSAALKRLEKKQMTIRDVLSRVGELACSLILEHYSGERIIRIKGGRVCKIVDKYPSALEDSLSYVQPDAPEPMMAPDMGAALAPEMGADPMAAMAQGMGMGGEPQGMGPGMGMGMPPVEAPVEAPVVEDEEAPDDTDLLVAREEWKAENAVDLVLEDINFKYDIVITADTALPEDRAARVSLASDMFRLGAIDRKALLDILDWPDATNVLRRLSAAETGKTPPEYSQDNAAAVQQQQMAEQQAQMRDVMPQ